MSIYEYNEEEHMRMEREDAFEDGWNEAHNQFFLLINKMEEEGLRDSIPKLAKDFEFYGEMLMKYNL